MKSFCLKVLLFGAQQGDLLDSFQNFRAMTSKNQIIRAKGYFRFYGNYICFASQPKPDGSGALFFRERDVVQYNTMPYSAQEARDLFTILRKECPMFTVLGRVTACTPSAEKIVRLTLENNQAITVVNATKIPFGLPVFALSMQQPSYRYYNSSSGIQFATCELFDLLKAEIDNCGNTPSQLFASVFSQLQTSGSQHEYQVASFCFQNQKQQQTLLAFARGHLVYLAVTADITAQTPFANCLACISTEYKNGHLAVDCVYYLKTSNLSAVYAKAFIYKIAGRLTWESFFGTITNAKLSNQGLEILALSPGLKSLYLKVSNVYAFRFSISDEQRFFLLLLRGSQNAEGTIPNMPHFFQVMRIEDALQVALALNYKAKIEDKILRIDGYLDKNVYKFVTFNPMSNKDTYFSKAISEDKQLVKIILGMDFPTEQPVSAIECQKVPSKHLFVGAKENYYFCKAELSNSELALYIEDECGYFTTDHFLGTVIEAQPLPYENQIALSVLDLQGGTRTIKLKSCKNFPWKKNVVALLINSRAASTPVIENLPSNIYFTTVEIAQRIATFLKYPIVTRNGVLCRVQAVKESIQVNNTYIYPLQPDSSPKFSYQIKFPLFVPLRIQCDFRVSQICMCGRLKLLVTNLPKATSNSFFLRLDNCERVYGTTSRLGQSEIAIVPQQVMQSFVQGFFQELLCQEEQCNFDIYGMLHHRAIEVRLNFMFARVSADCVRANDFLLIGRLVFTENSGYTEDY